MSKFLLLASLSLLPALAGCPTGDPDSPSETGPCDEAWGTLPGDAIHVDASASEDDGADGSLSLPLPTLQGALALARSSGRRAIALAPGEYRSDAANRWFALGAVHGDDDLVLAGCGVDETALVAIEAPPMGGDPEDPDELQTVLEVSGAVQGLRVHDLSIRGGMRGLIVREGPGSEREIRFERVRVEDSVRSGIVVSGLDTRVVFAGVTVDGVATLPGGQLGYGVAIQAGGSVWNEPTGLVTMEGGLVRGAQQVGVLVDRMDTELLGVTVEETAPSEDGSLGRGVQVQNNATALLDAVVSRGNRDAGVFVHLPIDVTLRNCVISETMRGVIPGAADQPSGDGLTVTQAGFGADPQEFLLTLSGNRFEDNGRAGAVVEGVAVVGPLGDVFSGNEIVSDGESYPLGPDADGLLLQDGATATGDAVPLGGDSGFAALEMNRDPVAVDEVGE
jgi:hypothetical protein